MYVGAGAALRFSAALRRPPRSSRTGHQVFTLLHQELRQLLVQLPALLVGCSFVELPHPAIAFAFMHASSNRNTA